MWLLTLVGASYYRDYASVSQLVSNHVAWGVFGLVNMMTTQIMEINLIFFICLYKDKNLHTYSAILGSYSPYSYICDLLWSSVLTFRSWIVQDSAARNKIMEMGQLPFPQVTSHNNHSNFRWQHCHFLTKKGTTFTKISGQHFILTLEQARYQIPNLS